MALTDKQQALILFLAILLATWSPTLSIWFNAGMPTDRLALGGLFAGLIGGLVAAVLAYIKEALGIEIPVPPPPQQTQTSSSDQKTNLVPSSITAFLFRPCGRAKLSIC